MCIPLLQNEAVNHLCEWLKSKINSKIGFELNPITLRQNEPVNRLSEWLNIKLNSKTGFDLAVNHLDEELYYCPTKLGS